ncbi:histone deacetylase 5 isoform X2 [Punica granatum]|uniref:histone deacetylase n=2 Tax=Punica granatum TaxID=22663 RepID=A0A218XZ46_PUNGR|nr:histone deacetylase 5 isoform X2 [Punica granatum]OWM90375.1 hypothetical protein CDL15_Pgr014677 [Punica granatum]
MATEVASGRGNSKIGKRVGLVYDERMCKHRTPDEEPHPENPNRIRVIWNKLHSAGIAQRCVVFSAKEAEDKYILPVHGKDHVNLIRNVSSKQYDSRRKRIAARLNSIYLNEGSSEAAYLAAGSVIDVAERVAKGELSSAFAIVRPPGHHAERDEAMGFCLYNNVAIATNYILNERSELGVKKILIVDWDIHHGNGTQKMFWKDPRVLFFSVHRHEFGSFYPANDEGDYTMIGEGPGAGYNINVPWENGRCGDADYLAVWDHMLMPVAREFNPDMIMVSAGFDAAMGDPLGGCRVTPYGYSVMLKKLMDFAKGKVVLALEGGYNLASIANSALACMEVLLDDKVTPGSTEAYPFESTWRVIQAVRRKLKSFWPTLSEELPTKLMSQITPLPIVISSDSEGEDEEVAQILLDRFPEVLQDIIQPLSALKVNDSDNVQTSSSWRSDFSKVDIWYASFGSNMWKPRFLCYIEGGQMEGMQKECSGSMDKSPPKEILWKTYAHQLFFGRESTKMWGPGGVAFIHPKSNHQDETYLCLYRITFEQFNDVLHQENITGSMDFPLLDLTGLSSVQEKGSITLEAVKSGCYRNVLYLGKVHGIPVLTMTCTLSDVEGFKSGKFPLRAPSREYTNTLVRGLVEGGLFSEEEAKAYIDEAASKSL